MKRTTLRFWVWTRHHSTVHALAFYFILQQTFLIVSTPLGGYPRIWLPQLLTKKDMLRHLVSYLHGTKGVCLRLHYKDDNVGVHHQCSLWHRLSMWLIWSPVWIWIHLKMQAVWVLIVHLLGILLDVVFSQNTEGYFVEFWWSWSVCSLECCLW